MSGQIVVIGAGCMGVATAYHLLAADPALSVTVFERDPSLARSSTLLSDGNVRVQFSLEENIAISLYALEALERFSDDLAVGDHRPEVAMKKQGNLFLVDEEGETAARAGLALQRNLGARVEWLDPPVIAQRFPPLWSPGMVGATFGPDDGSVDPSAVTTGYRRKAQSQGAVIERAEVERLEVSDARVTGLHLGDGSFRPADAVVVCAGAWSTSLLGTVGVEIPVVPVMRTVYVVTTDVGKGIDLPSVFLPSGVYLIPEQDDTFLVAWSRPDDPVGFDFTPADRSRFYDTIWPELFEALPAFDRLEVVRSWAGLYAQNTFDANAIVGEWPTITGLYQATGFSGHGFQQCHAVGRYLAELITGRPPFLDLSRLGPDRLLSGRRVLEYAARLI